MGIEPISAVSQTAGVTNLPSSTIVFRVGFYTTHRTRWDWLCEIRSSENWVNPTINTQYNLPSAIACLEINPRCMTLATSYTI